MKIVSVAINPVNADLYAVDEKGDLYKKAYMLSVNDQFQVPYWKFEHVFEAENARKLIANFNKAIEDNHKIPARLGKYARKEIFKK